MQKWVNMWAWSQRFRALCVQLNITPPQPKTSSYTYAPFEWHLLGVFFYTCTLSLPGIWMGLPYLLLFSHRLHTCFRLSRPSVVPPTTGTWTALRTTCSRDTRGRILTGHSMTLRASCTMRELDCNVMDNCDASGFYQSGSCSWG